MFQKSIVTVFLFITFAVDAQDVFEMARKGDLIAIEKFNKQNPGKLSATNEHGYTPLMLAAYYGQLEMAIYLVENGAELDGKSNYGTPIMAAAIKGNKEIVGLLLDNGANPNISDTRGNTALLYAAAFNLNEIAELLLKGGANSKLKDNRGNMALDYAILKENETLIKLLNQYR